MHIVPARVELPGKKKKLYTVYLVKGRVKMW